MLEISNMGRKIRQSRTTVKPTNEVDSKGCLVELETAANIFASETATVKNSYKELHDNYGKLPGSKKHGWRKQISVGKNTDLNKINSVKRQIIDSMNKHKQKKQHSKRNRKLCSDAMGKEDGYNKITDSEEEDWLGWDSKISQMMPHPTSDIAKVLQSKKNIKTKKNFQFKFNNFTRQNGSVGTVLSTEGKILTCFTKNVEDNWCEVSKELRGVIRPCSVRLSRLSEAELMNIGHLLVPSDNRKGRSISVSAHRYRQSRMKKSRSDMSVKPTVRVPSELDKTELHLELEKAASTFASEVKPNSYIPFEAEYENSESFVVPKKDKGGKAASINENHDKKGHMNSLNGNSNVLTNNMVQKTRQKRHTARSNKNVSVSQHAHVAIADSEVEDEDWLGWNSRVTPLDTIPGGEIVSVKENDHVEQLINWNMKVESDSDMDVEEVFLLTDLVEIKKKNNSTESLSSDSEDEWPGWPEYKPPSTLYYIFKV